jgi:hypothetical protein
LGIPILEYFQKMNFSRNRCDPTGLESAHHSRHDGRMKKSDLTCPTCHAGYRRIELSSRPGTKGQYHCLLCNEVLETFDGSTDVAIRLTVQPEKTFELQAKPQ